MSGKYIPLIKGEIHGFEIGVDTQLPLRDHCENLKSSKLSEEYLVGFGVGYTKAQLIRQQLKSSSDRLNFQEKERLFKFITVKHIGKYGKFQELSKKFLDNIDNWDQEEIPEKIHREVNELLKAKKTQRAIDKVYNFNYSEHRIQLIIDYEEIKSMLPKLRYQKERGEIDSKGRERGLIEIEKLLQDWLSKRRTDYKKDRK